MKRVSTLLKAIPTVRTMQSSRGNDVPNQLIIHTNDGTFFQSYDSIIAIQTKDGRTLLDERYWDYSATTGKYRNDFLGENIAETRLKIESGEYKLVNLN